MMKNTGETLMQQPRKLDATLELIGEDDSLSTPFLSSVVCCP